MNYGGFGLASIEGFPLLFAALRKGRNLPVLCIWRGTAPPSWELSPMYQQSDGTIRAVKYTGLDEIAGSDFEQRNMRRATPPKGKSRDYM